MLCFLVLVLVIIISGLLYRKATQINKYWINKGVKQSTPKLIFGDLHGPVTKRISWTDLSQHLYNENKSSRYIGIYQFMTPTLLLKDPELIKQITVQDYDHFLDHYAVIPEECDRLWSQNLFALTGTKWRHMRANLSPAFTSSKMKFIVSSITKICEQFINFFEKKRNEEVIILEMKDTLTRFANDIIANTAFGVQCNSLEDRNNEFYLSGKEVTNFVGLAATLKTLGVYLVPSLMKLFKIGIFSEKVSSFYLSLIQTNIKSRETNNIVRPDMINLMLEARKNENLEITDADIASQAFSFVFAGFESVSSVMCFMSYELAVNTEIQAKLIEEVDQVYQKFGGFTYDASLEMKYMDMVISETLRKWPNNIIADRQCTKAYTIKSKQHDEIDVEIDKKSVVWIPIFSIHRDPKYWPNPERFDPERFNEENKKTITPYTFLPFGCGPRACIGARFALLEIKMLYFYILKNFEIIPVEKTQIPIIVSKEKANLDAEGGFWLGLKRRSV